MLDQHFSLYKTLFELSDDAVLILDEDSIVQCNPACLRILKAESPIQILSSHPAELSPPLQTDGSNSKEKAKKLIFECFEKGFIKFDWTHRRFSGEDFPAEVTLTRFEYGKKNLVLAVIRDLSEWIDSETARKDAEDRLQFIANNTEDIIWMRDMRFRYTYLSPSVYRVKGYTVEEALQLTPTQTAHRDDIKKAIENLREELEKEKDPNSDPGRSRRFQMREYKKDGSQIWTEQSMSFIRNNNNTPIGIMGITRDISEHVTILDDLKRAKNQAEESDRLKSSFLANMSHEIRTPLNAILGFAELVGDNQIDHEEKRMFIGIIRKSSNQLLDIISNIFDISKLETKQLVLNLHTHNIKSIIEGFIDIKDDLDPEVSSNYEFTIDTIPDHFDRSYILDKERLIQIIRNLIDNAFKFSSRGKISLGAELAGHKQIRIFVKDNGPGIKAKNTTLIFERFRQAHESLDRKFGGTGLGLAICRSLVELMDGEIGVISEEGHGSEFWFTIPLNPSG
ncbi:MAG: PAS domain S-box protein [Bacteroidales bacterium]|nr:PAS domain S-box protein [Bacteroidales bacterium]